MALRILAYALDASAAIFFSLLLPLHIFPAESNDSTSTAEGNGAKSAGVRICLAALLYALFKWAMLKFFRGISREETSIYGLEHGRLHLQTPTSMWMNMGYWRHGSTTPTMAVACRDLLRTVLASAEFPSKVETDGFGKGKRQQRMLIDLGFGCGDQTMYLMSQSPIRPCDSDWWDEREHCPQFDHYIGITKDPEQARYASDRVEELKLSGKMASHLNRDKDNPSVSIFCADASPATWSDQIRRTVERSAENAPDRWVLALDTAYHFSPSRWPVINYACTGLCANLIAFDLCLSPTATVAQKLMLRTLTTLMGAPWLNFVTPNGYRDKLVEIGYSKDAIKIVDVSEHVFIPLAKYLTEQDSRLKVLGFGIGSLRVAKSMFDWWGRSGVVRGVIVVAKSGKDRES